jgi:SAM-dependent methyltransferase
MSDYVFRKNGGTIEFVGDFDGLYLNDSDPWGQSGQSRVSYSFSRARQLEILSKTSKEGYLLDIGCGLGFTTSNFSSQYKADGVDISSVAIDKARTLYPNIEFDVADICSKSFNHGKKYDVVVLNQLLWYTIHDFQQCMENLSGLIKPGGGVLISNFIFNNENQKYAREYFCGHVDIIRWLDSISKYNGFEIISYECHPLDDMYFDFHAFLRRAK